MHVVWFAHVHLRNPARFTPFVSLGVRLAGDVPVHIALALQALENHPHDAAVSADALRLLKVSCNVADRVGVHSVLRRQDAIREALQRHRSSEDVVAEGINTLANVAYVRPSARFHLRDAAPLAVALLRQHASVALVATAAATLLWHLARRVDNRAGLVALVGPVVAVCAAHAHCPDTTLACLGFLRTMCDCGTHLDVVGPQAVQVASRALLTHAAHPAVVKNALRCLANAVSPGSRSPPGLAPAVAAALPVALRAWGSHQMYAPVALAGLLLLRHVLAVACAPGSTSAGPTGCTGSGSSGVGVARGPSLHDGLSLLALDVNWDLVRRWSVAVAARHRSTARVVLEAEPVVTALNHMLASKGAPASRAL